MILSSAMGQGIKILLPLYAAGHPTLKRQSRQNALSIQQWAFAHPTSSKKQRHCVLFAVA